MTNRPRLRRKNGASPAPISRAPLPSTTAQPRCSDNQVTMRPGNKGLLENRRFKNALVSMDSELLAQRRRGGEALPGYRLAPIGVAGPQAVIGPGQCRIRIFIVTGTTREGLRQHPVLSVS